MANQGTIRITYVMKGDKSSFKALVNDANGLKSAMNGTMVQGNSLTRMLGTFGQSASGAGNQVSVFSKLLNTGLGSLTKWAGGIGTATLALEGAKKVIEGSESTHDAYARVIAQCTDVTEGFFSSLSMGSFDSFLNGLDGIINRAKEAYNAIDELGSFSVRSTPAMANLEKQIQALRMQARTQNAEHDIAGAKATMARVNKLEAQLTKLQRTTATKTENAGYATLRELLGGTGVSFSNAQLAWHANPTNWNEDKRYANMWTSKNGQKLLDYYNKTLTVGDNGVSAKAALGTINKTFGSLNNLLKAQRSYISQNVRDSDTDKGKLLATAFQQIYAKSDTEADIAMRQARNDMTAARINNTSSRVSTTTKKNGEIYASITPVIESTKINQSQSDLSKLISDYQKKLVETTNQTEYNAIQKEIDKLQSLLEYMQKNGLAEAGSANLTKSFNDKWNKELADGLKKSLEGMDLSIPVSFGKPDSDEMMSTTKEAATGIAGALSAASNAMSQFGEASSEAAQAAKVMSIASSIAQLVAQFASIPKGSEIWSWVAGTIAGTAALVSSIAQIRSATAFANGGIVSGPTHALVAEYPGAKSNPEVIAPLNRLKGMLGSDDSLGGDVRFHISGRDLEGVLVKRANLISRS